MVTPIQVYDILKKLLNSKATGIHEIPKKILKACSDITSPHLSQIFNISLMTKCYPDSLKFAKVAPVYKGGDKDNLDNYRPMSVLPTVARVYEKLIYEQMIKYFESNDLLGKKQRGFRSLHSTVLPLMSKTNDWFVNISKGHLNAVVFLDVKKAFDTIDHNILLDKLSHYGIVNEVLSFFKSYPPPTTGISNVPSSTCLDLKLHTFKVRKKSSLPEVKFQTLPEPLLNKNI